MQKIIFSYSNDSEEKGWREYHWEGMICWSRVNLTTEDTDFYITEIHGRLLRNFLATEAQTTQRVAAQLFSRKVAKSQIRMPLITQIIKYELELLTQFVGH